MSIFTENNKAYSIASRRFFLWLNITIGGLIIMNEEVRIKLEELESLLLIMSRGLETSDESFKAKDISNLLAVIERELNNILK